MTIEMRAQRAGAEVRATAEKGRDPMEVLQELTETHTVTHQRRNRLLAAAAAVALLVGAAVVLPQLTQDPAPPAGEGLPRVTGVGISAAIPEGWKNSGELAPEVGFVLVDVPTGAAPSTGYVNSNIVAFSVARVWDPVAQSWNEVPEEGYLARLQNNPAIVIESVTPVTVAGQETSTVRFSYNSGAYGENFMPLVQTTEPPTPESVKGWPGYDLVGEPIGYNPGETGFQTPIQVDGQTVILETWLWPPGNVISEYKISEEQLSADYQTVLASTRIE